MLGKDKLPSFSPKVASPWLSTAANPRVGIYDGRRLPPSKSLSSWLLRAETAAVEAEPLLPPSNSKRGRGLLDPCKKNTMFNVLDIFWSVFGGRKKIPVYRGNESKNSYCPKANQKVLSYQ